MVVKGFSLSREVSMLLVLLLQENANISTEQRKIQFVSGFIENPKIKRDTIHFTFSQSNSKKVTAFVLTILFVLMIPIRLIIRPSNNM